MLARTFSATVIGIDAHLVELEVNATGKGGSAGEAQANVSIVGLPDAAVKESRDRVRSALQSSGLPHPKGFTVVNLAPADLKKEGAAFDLGIALGMQAANGGLNCERLEMTAVLGELALNGSVRPVRGVFPAVMMLAENPNIQAIIVPRANAEEAALATERHIIYPVDHLTQAIDLVNSGNGELFTSSIAEKFSPTCEWQPDFSEVKGQAKAKRALEIAAAGGHNSLMIGPPGTGKSMLASRLAGILPPMSRQEMLETSRIHSVFGLLAKGQPIVNSRPFRSPHHTISDIGLIGGGKDIRPGEISLAHNGVLFMDEFPEFKRNVLEVLRQPLENGYITISRASGSSLFPARFMLCAAMNPCPCGRGEVELGCVCKNLEKQRYLKKISGPLMDRIDLHVEVSQLTQDELLAAPTGESSSTILARVINARNMQTERYKGTPIHCNAQMSSRDLQRYCKLDASSQQLVRQAITAFKLSPRAYDRILKVARTIADLAKSSAIGQEHIFEAISYRKNME